MKNIQNLLTNYKTNIKKMTPIMKKIIYDPPKKPIMEPRRRWHFYYSLPKWVDLLIALIVLLVGILDSLSREFKFENFLTAFFVFLVVYIFLLLLRYSYKR